MHRIYEKIIIYKRGDRMTVEQQRYLEECKKVLDVEQAETVAMALDYGLQIPEIRKVVQGNLSADCMHEVILGLMDGIDGDAVDFLCENHFNRYQIREIVEGLLNGLPFEQVKTYAAGEMSASRMRKMRRQLEEMARPGKEDKEGGAREYMKGLAEVMETSIRQFQESNERFDALSSLVKEHVVEEKNRELQDLYENLRYKDKTIQQLQEKLADRERKIGELEAIMKRPQKQARNGKQNQGAGGQHTEDRTKKPSEDSHTVWKRGMKSEEKEALDISGAEGDRRLKKRMVSWLAFWNRGKKKDVLGRIMEANLSPQQLEEVCRCLESGLTDEEIGSLIENEPSPERIRKMREILLLMRKRKGGE